MDKFELPVRRHALFVAVAKPPAVNAELAVNKPAVNKRGAYPGTDARRVYMRAYMKKRRSR